MQNFENIAFHIDMALPNIKAKTISQAIVTIAKYAAPFLRKDPKNLNAKINQACDRDNIAIGDGIAIIQIKSFNISFPRIIVASCDSSIEYETPDGQPLSIICVICAPASESNGELLRRMSRLSRLIKNPEILSSLNEAQDPEIMRSILMNPEGWMLAA